MSTQDPRKATGRVLGELVGEPGLVEAILSLGEVTEYTCQVVGLGVTEGQVIGVFNFTASGDDNLRRFRERIMENPNFRKLVGDTVRKLGLSLFSPNYIQLSGTVRPRLIWASNGGWSETDRLATIRECGFRPEVPVRVQINPWSELANQSDDSYKEHLKELGVKRLCYYW